MGSLTPLLMILLVLGFAFSSTTMAADCTFNTQNFIQTSDIIAFISAVDTNNFSPQLDDPLGFTPDDTKTFTPPGTTICIRNDFLFESTHIKLSDIAFGASDIVSQCCTADVCQGGHFTITGDTGLTVILSVQPAGTSC